MARGPNDEAEDFQPGGFFAFGGTSADRRATNLDKYRADEWREYRPSLLRRMIQRLRHRAK
jgi:hypothetical protein